MTFLLSLIVLLSAPDRSVAIFAPLKYLGLLRIDKETEEKGIDMVKHGEAAYPAEESEIEIANSNC